MSRAVICTVMNPAHAETIVTRLEHAGVPRPHLSVLMHDRSDSRDFADEHDTRAPEGATIGGSAGGMAGGVFGLLAGIGALTIPGAGPFIAAGPILAALSGAAVGATLGGITGALIGFGLPEHEAKIWESRVKEGHILISVHTHDQDEAQRIEEILVHAEADNVSITGEDDIAVFDAHEVKRLRHR